MAVVVLCERRELQTVCELPFLELSDDVKDILSTKAVNMDVYAALSAEEPNFYEVRRLFCKDIAAAANLWARVVIYRVAG